MNQHKNRIAFIKARWHAEIVDQCEKGFKEKLNSDDQFPADIEIFEVPGAYEIPLLAKQLAKSGNYDAIACAALVVDGGIYRHDFVANAVLNGMMQVQLETDIPVFTAVLTPHHFHGAEHHKYFFDHFLIKGRELADACRSILEQKIQLIKAA